MRLYEINSNQKNLMGYTNEDLLDLIKKDCSKAYNILLTTNRVLYRGVKNKQTDAYIASSHSFRNPVDTDAEFHVAFNEIVTIAGFKANRSNSIFCTSDLSMAEGYGWPYAIFPFDTSNILWSAKIKDMYRTIEQPGIIDMLLAKTIVKDFKNFNKTDNKEEFARQFIQKWKFKDTDLLSALKSKNEVLVNGYYYAVSYRRLIKMFQ